MQSTIVLRILIVLLTIACGSNPQMAFGERLLDQKKIVAEIEFESEWLNFLNNLLTEGEKAGPLNLVELKRNSSNINWYNQVDESECLDLSKNRKSACFHRPTNSIRVIELLSGFPKFEREILACHEVISFYYNDVDYQVCMALYMLYLTQRRNLPSDEQYFESTLLFLTQPISDEISSSIMPGEEGSATSVGGGGDIYELSLKLKLYRLLLREGIYLSETIEFLQMFTFQFVRQSSDLELSIKNSIPTRQFIFSIKDSFRKSDEFPSHLVNRLYDVIKVLLRRYRGLEVDRKITLSCRDGVNEFDFSFGRLNSIEVVSIVELLHPVNCEKFYE